MKERPIIFTHNIDKLLSGEKTQTRRVVKDQRAFAELGDILCAWTGFMGWQEVETALDRENAGMNTNPGIRCRYGFKGDRLWVKEGFALEHEVDGNEAPHNDGRPIAREDKTDYEWSQPHYRATDPEPDLECVNPRHKRCEGQPCINPWVSPMFMPRWVSRITLELIDMRVQRVQGISYEDIAAEGWQKATTFVAEEEVHREAARDWWMDTWDSINLKRSPWESNPWVWSLTFKRVN